MTYSKARTGGILALETLIGFSDSGGMFVRGHIMAHSLLLPQTSLWDNSTLFSVVECNHIETTFRSLLTQFCLNMNKPTLFLNSYGWHPALAHNKACV